MSIDGANAFAILRNTGLVEAFNSSTAPHPGALWGLAVTSWFDNDVVASLRVHHIIPNMEPFDDLDAYHRYIRAVRLSVFIPLMIISACMAVYYVAFPYIPTYTDENPRGPSCCASKRLTAEETTARSSTGGDTVGKSLVASYLYGVMGVWLFIGEVTALCVVCHWEPNMHEFIEHFNVVVWGWITVSSSLILLSLMMMLKAMRGIFGKDDDHENHWGTMKDSQTYVRIPQPSLVDVYCALLLVPAAVMTWYEGSQMAHETDRNHYIAASMMFQAAVIGRWFWWAVLVLCMKGDALANIGKIYLRTNVRDDVLRHLADGQQWFMGTIAAFLVILSADNTEIIMGWFHTNDEVAWYSFVVYLMLFNLCLVMTCLILWFVNMCRAQTCPSKVVGAKPEGLQESFHSRDGGSGDRYHRQDDDRYDYTRRGRHDGRHDGRGDGHRGDDHRGDDHWRDGRQGRRKDGRKDGRNEERRP
jgi:hypothetical protein